MHHLYKYLLISLIIFSSCNLKQRTVKKDFKNFKQRCIKKEKIEICLSNHASNAKSILKRGCDLNMGKYCYFYGNFYKNGKAFEQNFKKSAIYFEKACNAKFYKACVVIGEQYYSGKGVKKDKDKAITFQKIGCDNGNLESCYKLGTYYLDDKEYKKSISLFNKTCRENHKSSCFKAGNQHLEGLGLKKNRVIATKFYKKGCKLKDGLSCRKIGEFSKTDKKSKLEIFKNFEKACLYDDIFSCKTALMMIIDEIKAKRIDKIVKKLNSLCNKNSLNSCRVLASFFDIFNRVPRFLKLRNKYLKRSCSLGGVVECYHLALYFQEFRHYKYEDQKYTYSLFKKACSGKNSDIKMPACFHLGVHYEKGIGVKVNLNKAEYYFKVVCSKKEDPGCAALGSLYLNTKTADKYLKKGKNLLVTSCKNDYIPACETLIDFYYNGTGLDRDKGEAFILASKTKFEINDYSSRIIRNILKDKKLKAIEKQIISNYMEKRCLDKDRYCTDYGKLFVNGFVVKKNFKKAKKIFGKHCSKNGLESCIELGSLILNGKTNRRTRKKGINFIKKACVKYKFAKCEILADFYFNGKVVKKDKKKALKILNKLCISKFPQTCVKLGDIYYSGKIIKKDLIKSREYYFKACSLGNMAGCKKQQKMK
jgi:uncharacterized protein